MDWGHYSKVVIGGLFAIAGVGGVPLAIMEGSVTKMVLFTLCLFIGIGILGKMSRD